MKKSLPFLTLVATASLGSAASLAAPLLTISSPSGSTAADSAALSFDATYDNVLRESFEGFTPGNANVYDPLTTTEVGTFSQGSAGTGGLCEPNCAGLRIFKDGGTSPFNGRFATEGDQWMDSNDSTEMTWTRNPPAGTSVNAVGFYITDPNDAGGRMDILTSDGTALSETFENIFGTGLSNGLEYFVTIDTGDPNAYIDSITWLSNNPDDGFGIDGFRIGEISPGGSQQIPTPSTLILMVLGFLGMGISALRWKK